MKIDLDREILKVTPVSERAVTPAETLAMVNERLAGLGWEFRQAVKKLDDKLWVSEPDWNASVMPDSAKGFRMGGKGATKEQCLASGSMEMIERWSLRRKELMKNDSLPCLDLRENRTYRIQPVLEMQNTKCSASGNNYEEAVLHCLHELIETRTSPADYFQPCRIVDTTQLFPDMPSWLSESIVLIRNPLPRPEFYKFTAIQYPFKREFDERRVFRLRKDGEWLQLRPERAEVKPHSPNSGGAAGINPEKTALRAINEVFQFQSDASDFRDCSRKKLPDGFPVADMREFINYETDSITADIKFILNLLGDAFIGIVDLTDPEIGIPVVKLISDYDPNRSLVSEDILSVFFSF